MQESSVTRGMLRAGPAAAETVSGSIGRCRKGPVLLCATVTALLGEGRDSHCFPGFGSLKRHISAHFLVRSEMQ